MTDADPQNPTSMTLDATSIAKVVETSRPHLTHLHPVVAIIVKKTIPIRGESDIKETVIRDTVAEVGMNQDQTVTICLQRDPAVICPNLSCTCSSSNTQIVRQCRETAIVLLIIP